MWATGPPNEVSPSRSETSRTSSQAGLPGAASRAVAATVLRPGAREPQAVSGSGASGSSPSSRIAAAAAAGS